MTIPLDVLLFHDDVILPASKEVEWQGGKVCESDNSCERLTVNFGVLCSIQLRLRHAYYRGANETAHGADR